MLVSGVMQVIKIDVTRDGEEMGLTQDGKLAFFKELSETHGISKVRRPSSRIAKPLRETEVGECRRSM